GLVLVDAHLRGRLELGHPLLRPVRRRAVRARTLLPGVRAPTGGEDDGGGEEWGGSADHGRESTKPDDPEHDEDMTLLTDALGTRVPVVCAPMAGVAGGRLAHAVSAAGGLGMIGAGGAASSEWITEQASL